MSASINDIVGQIRGTLAVTDPDLDTSAGTTTRKIIDAVAESIAEAYLDQHMLAYTYDIDTKVEGDLDSFCQTFGIARLAAKRATGTITFTRSGEATSLVFIPVNTQVDANTEEPVSVQTLVGAQMEPGQLSVTVPVQAVVAGPTGNVPAGSLTRFATPLAGIGSVTNTTALTGGMLQETDSELRERWKRTVFRSLAGTEQMYLGCALNDASCTSANVIGASKRRREQVQISGGEAISQVDDAAYIFPDGVFLGANLDAGAILLKDTHYTWDTTVNPPKVVIAAGVSSYDTGERDESGNAIMAPIEGAVLDLDFAYTPKASRNDPENGVLHRIDVWCAGRRPVEARQSVVFRQVVRFNTTPGDPLERTRFVRPDGTSPADNNVFIPLAFGPIITIPDILTVGGDTYGRMGASVTGVTYPNAFALVHDDSAEGYTATSRFGIEWSAAALPPSNSVFTVGGNGDYTYNEVPRAVQDQIDRWRLMSVDARAHAAKEVYLRFAFALIYTRSANQDEVNEAIDTALSTFLGGLGLGSLVQTSDILQVVHNVPGVDAVRFIGKNDISGYDQAQVNTYNMGIQEVVEGTVVKTWVSPTGVLTDPRYGDNEVPVFSSAHKVVRAQNTFGVGA